MIFLIIWFWHYAIVFNFDVWKNIAVLLITLLILGGLLGAIWARWGMKNAWKFDKQATYYSKKENKEKPENKKE
jgi:Na+/glutamate symporter